MTSSRAPMGLTGEEIRRRLEALAARWSVYDGSERAEAQTFLNQLFECYGQERGEVAHFEQPQAGRFVDLIWPRVCLIEMKAPSEAGRLARHRAQALDYWRDAADPERGVEAPRFVVICAFRTLEIWEPGRFPKAPRETIELSELPEQYDALLFLADEEPVFTGGQAKLTRDAVEHVTDIHHRLGGRRAADPDVLRDFLLQSVWSMFAEDLGQIPGHRFTRIVDELLAQRARSSADDLGGLFETLNDPRRPRPEHGLYAGVPYANGGLFERPARVHLDAEELGLLRVACGFNWREVDPQIFGSLLEKGLGHDTQWQLGAHYTHAADIQKVIHRRSCAPGASGSRTCQRTPRRSPRTTTSWTTWCSIRPAVRETSSTSPTASCDGSSTACARGRRSCAIRRVCVGARRPRSPSSRSRTSGESRSTPSRWRSRE